MDLDIFYNEEADTINAEWKGNEELIQTVFYVRYNNEPEFTEYKKYDLDLTLEEEERTALYTEELEIEKDNMEYVEFRAIGTTIYGLEIKSNIITLQNKKEGLEKVTRDSDNDKKYICI